MNVWNLIHGLYLLEFASQIIPGYVNELSYRCKTLHCFWKAKQIYTCAGQMLASSREELSLLQRTKEQVSDIFIF